jgi:hypothetical protein
MKFETVLLHNGKIVTITYRSKKIAVPCYGWQDFDNRVMGDIYVYEGSLEDFKVLLFPWWGSSI